MPYLYYIDHIDDPDYFTSCYFDIGEPVLYVGKEKLEGNIVCFKDGDHHTICRIDSVVKGTAENVFDIKESLQSTCTDVENSEISVSSDQCFAVMGVLAPAKLKESYVFDQYQDDIRITNRVETLDYTFISDQSAIKYTKPVYLSRKNVEEKDGNYDSVLEYYHVFDSNDFEVGKIFQVIVKGIDKNGEEVKGTEECFTVEFRTDIPKGK